MDRKTIEMIRKILLDLIIRNMDEGADLLEAKEMAHNRLNHEFPELYASYIIYEQTHEKEVIKK